MKASADDFSWSRVQKWTLAARASRFDLRQLANDLGVTVRQISRYFQKELGRTPQDWLDEQRMIAARLMLSHHQPVKRIAMELGFKQSAHFCRQFKKFYGMPPSEFLQLQQRLESQNFKRNGKMSLMDNKCP
jgi:transcriptional regulator GlxA family with amidase domain